MKVIGKIFAVIFCIIYFFLLTSLMLLAFSSNIVSSNYYTDVLTNVDLKTLKISDFDKLFNNSEFDEDTTVENVIFEYFAQSDVEKEKVEALLNNKEAKKTAANVMGSIFSYAMGGEKPTISKEEVNEFFNSEVVIAVAGEPTQENIDYVYNQLNKLIEEVEGGINVGNTKRNADSVEVYR